MKNNVIYNEEESVQDQTYKKLREYILSGQIQSGSKLSQRNIAKKFGVTTTPVREALLRLEAESLVESIPGLGTRIRPMDASVVRGISALRRAIECECTRMCSSHASKEELSKIMEYAIKCDDLLSADPDKIDFDSLTHFDYLFHSGIAKGTHCREIIKEFSRINVINVFSHVQTGGRYYSTTVPHTKIAQALLDGNSEKASELMRAHVNAASAEIIRYYEK